MTLHTKLCDLLGVKHPIMLAGMGGVSYAELAAAVSNAGGYGVLGMAGRHWGSSASGARRPRGSPA